MEPALGDVSFLTRTTVPRLETGERLVVAITVPRSPGHIAQVTVHQDGPEAKSIPVTLVETPE